MGYIIVIALLIIVPFLFILLSRRTSSTGGIGRSDRGVTVSSPSSDQPSPAGGAVNQPRSDVGQKLPPG